MGTGKATFLRPFKSSKGLIEFHLLIEAEEEEKTVDLR